MCETSEEALTRIDFCCAAKVMMKTKWIPVSLSRSSSNRENLIVIMMMLLHSMSSMSIKVILISHEGV